MSTVERIEPSFFDYHFSSSDPNFFNCANPRRLERGDRSSKFYQDSLDFVKSCKSGNLEEVKSFLENDQVDPSVNDNRAIISVCSNGYLEIAELLLKDNRVNPSYLGNAALRWACWNNHYEIVKLLLRDNRIHLPVDESIISMVCMNNLYKILELLLTDGKGDPSGIANRIVARACVRGYLEIIDILIADSRVDLSIGLKYAKDLKVREYVQLALRKREMKY